MTISNTNNRMDYVGDDGTDTYAYTYKIYENADLLVTQRDLNDVESALTLDVDYTVTGAGETTGGNVVLTAGNLASGYLMSIRRVRDLTQEADIRNQGDFFAEIHENVFDKIVMLLQQLKNDIDRSLQLSETGTGVDLTLPIPVAEEFIRWDSAGTALESINVGSTTLAIPASESVTAAMIDVDDIAAIRTKLLVSSKAEIQAGGLVYVADTGAADVYVGTYVPALTAYTVGQKLVLKITNANLTTTPTANFNALGAKTIKRMDGSALVVGDLPVNHFAILIPDGTDLLLVNPARIGRKALYRYVVATTVDGGTSVNTTWNVRPFNTEEYDDIGISLSGNQFTVPAGTYNIEAFGMVTEAGQHQLALYNTTDTSYDLIGFSSRDVSSTADAPGEMVGRITIAAEKVFELRHYTTLGFASTGLGTSSDTGQDEIYASLKFEKVA